MRENNFTIFDTAKRIINDPENSEILNMFHRAEIANETLKNGSLERIGHLWKDIQNAQALELVSCAVNLLAIEEGRSPDENLDLKTQNKERLKLKIDQLRDDFSSNWRIENTEAKKLATGNAKIREPLVGATLAIIISFMKPAQCKKIGHEYRFSEEDEEFTVPGTFIERVQTQIGQSV